MPGLGVLVLGNIPWSGGGKMGAFAAKPSRATTLPPWLCLGQYSECQESSTSTHTHTVPEAHGKPLLEASGTPGLKGPCDFASILLKFSGGPGRVFLKSIQASRNRRPVGSHSFNTGALVTSPASQGALSKSMLQSHDLCRGRPCT